MDLQSTETVVGPLNEAFVAISNICKSLLEAQVDPITGICSNYGKIREHIEQAEQCLGKSETKVKGKLEGLDEQMERLIRDKGNTEQQLKEKQKAKDKLHIEKESAEESLKISKAALEQAKKTVELTKDVIKKQTDRQNTGTGVTAAGAAVMLIPVLGWIAGPIMIGVGASEIVEASKAVREAEDELKKHESEVNEKNIKVSGYESRISTIQNEIEVTEKLLKNIQREIEEVKQHLEVTAGIQETVRKAVNLLSVLTGRVSVLESQTKRTILWKPVVKAMEDVIKAIGNVAENPFLYCGGASGLINSLRGNAEGLLALCNSPSCTEHDSYY